jgi:hypothetical protein
MSLAGAVLAGLGAVLWAAGATVLLADAEGISRRIGMPIDPAFHHSLNDLLSWIFDLRWAAMLLVCCGTAVAARAAGRGAAWVPVPGLLWLLLLERVASQQDWRSVEAFAALSAVAVVGCAAAAVCAALVVALRRGAGGAGPASPLAQRSPTRNRALVVLACAAAVAAPAAAFHGQPSTSTITGEVSSTFLLVHVLVQVGLAAAAVLAALAISGVPTRRRVIGGVALFGFVSAGLVACGAAAATADVSSWGTGFAGLLLVGVIALALPRPSSVYWFGSFCMALLLPFVADVMSLLLYPVPLPLLHIGGGSDDTVFDSGVMVVQSAVLGAAIGLYLTSRAARPHPWSLSAQD